MPEEQKPQSNQTPAKEPGPSASNISPAPTDFDDAKNKPNAKKDAPAEAAPPVSTEPLSDGTIPTVLTPGQSHRSVPKSKASLNNIYRKADIMTTLLTFLGVGIAAALILGGYAYFTRPRTKPTATPKVTSLNSSDLKSLNDFFNGNSAGTGSSEVLTVTSPSLFNSRVGVASDLAVTGGVSVTGPTALGALTVDQQSDLDVTDVRGTLTVGGPANFQSATTLSDGGTVNGDLAVSGSGSYGGSISAGTINAKSLSVSTLNLNGNLSIGGANVLASATGSGSSASVQGNDSAGSVAVFAPKSASGGIVTVNFTSKFTAIPSVTITPIGESSAQAEPYITATASGFTIGIVSAPNSGDYAFNYWVVEF